MKIFTSILTFTLISFISFAQTDKSTKTKDTTYLNIDNKEIIIIENQKNKTNQHFDNNVKSTHFYTGHHCSNNINMNFFWNRRFNSHYSGIEFGINNYLNSDNNMQVPKTNEYGHFMEIEDSKSMEFNLNLGDVSIPIIKKRLGIGTGLGFNWNNYNFSNRQLVLQNDADSIYVIEDTQTTYNKNKLATFYMNVPIMIEYQHPIGNSLMWLSFGFYGGLKLGSKVKLKTNNNKNKIRKDYHLNTLRYGLRAQAGFNNFGIYCKYSLTSLFKKDAGPELYPLSLGVSLIF